MAENKENEANAFDDEMEFAVPSNAMATVRRLWKAMGRQRLRLVIVVVSVIFYTVLSVAAPVYSAGIVDLLWKEIRSSIEEGTAFRVTWEHGGREIMILLGIYTATGILYTFQSFVMASFAERLSLELRTQISRKLDRLPLSVRKCHHIHLKPVCRKCEERAELLILRTPAPYWDQDRIHGCLPLIFRCALFWNFSIIGSLSLSAVPCHIICIIP